MPAPRPVAVLRHALPRAALLLALALAGASSAGQPGPAAAAASVAERPLDRLPYVPALDPGSLDRSADPCEDFYRFACGGWQQAHPIPADQGSWDVYSKMSEDNRRLLWGILERLARTAEGRTPDQAKIGDAFEACMNDTVADVLGTAALAPVLEPVQALRSRRELPAVIAAAQLQTNDPGLLFAIAAAPDYADSRRTIAYLNAGGLGLPDRDDYLRADARSRTLRATYLLHVAHMFTLLGDAAGPARREAEAVLAIETALARATLTLVDERDPTRLDHPVDRRGLQALMRGFDLNAYVRALGIPAADAFNASEPAFLRAVAAQLRRRPLAELRAYLRWHIAHAFAPWMSSDFVGEDFDFFRRTLAGVPELAPRWKRCVTLVDAQLGEALGQEFVRLTFSPELRARTLRMTEQIEEAMAREIRELDWMGPQTKARAIEKLQGIVNKVGYPDRWRDYAGLAIRRDDLVGNVRRANEFELRRQLAKVGQAVDRSEWVMTPQTVDAYYEPQMNTINFPAGVLQPPLFDARLDDAPNYGDTGATIGHELTHGFDDEGRLFDGVGTLRNWWAPDDARQFTRRTQCLIDQYSRYVVVDDVHINGQLTVGEDLADLGGVVLALSAWQAQRTDAARAEPVDGFTPEQRFFLGNAQWACSNDRPEQLRLRAHTDPHSPNRYRVNGLVANLVEFQQAFHCRSGQPMAPERRCRIW